MKDKNSNNIATIGLWELLDYLFTTDEFPQGNGQTAKAVEGEKSFYTIQWPITRRIFNAYWVLSDELKKVADEHRALHKSGKTMPEHSCTEYAKNIDLLADKLSVLQPLFWMAASQECSCFSLGGVYIRNGWELFRKADNKPCDIGALAGDGESVTMNLFNSLSEILTGELVLIDNVDHAKIQDGEKVIGTLTDSRVRGVSALMGRYDKGVKANMSVVIPSLRDDMPDKEIEDVIDNLSPQEKIQWGHFSEVVDRNRKLLGNIFWAGVHGTVKGSDAPGTIGMRADWQVVSMPDDKPEVVMTPLGPAIAISVPGSVLAGLLARGR